MTSRKKIWPDERSERPFVITRVFDAPRKRVFEAWIRPEIVKNWWGPKSYTTPLCNIDLRTGGLFRYCMNSPEGKVYCGRGVYREIITPERIVYSDSFADERGNPVPPSDYGMPDWPAETLVKVNFSEAGGKTTLTLESSVSEELAEKQGARQGWSESLDRLAEYLSQG